MNDEISTRVQEVLSHMVTSQKLLVTDIIALRALVLAIAMQPTVDSKKLGEDALRLLESHVAKDSEGLDPKHLDRARSMISEIVAQGSGLTQP